jgi:murein DD-endopeptidase MepM/ murein hydrolase activator NlpD
MRKGLISASICLLAALILPNTVIYARGKGKVTRPRRVSVAYRPINTPLFFPVEGALTGQYGENRRTHSHKGIDIAADPGTPIFAAGSGEVVTAGWVQGYGRTVVIQHADGRSTRYAHAERLLVIEGDLVEVGQQIATVGSSGNSTGPHLHFEILTTDGVSLDPLRILRFEQAVDQAGEAEMVEEALTSTGEARRTSRISTQPIDNPKP